MQSIGVCIVIQEHHKLSETKACLLNLYEQSKGSILNFYILNNGNNDEDMKKFLSSISEVMVYETANPTKGFYNHFFKPIPYYQAFNELVKQTTEDYVCLFKNGVFVNKNWYATALHSFNQIQNTGAISIKSGISETEITLMSNGDFEMIEVHAPKKPFQMDGILFCSRQVLFTIGCFCDKLFDTGFEVEEFLRRLGSNGLSSYYVKNENCIDLDIVKTEPRTIQGESLMNNTIKEMKINGMFKTQL